MMSSTCMRRMTLAVAASVLILLSPGFCDEAAAATIDTSSSGRTTFFDDFPYTNRSAYVVCGRDTCDKGGSTPAVQFVATATGTATRVVVPVSAYGYGYPSDVRITVRRDSHGSPGRVIGKRNVTAPSCCAAMTLRMKLHLAYGEAYWVEIAPRTNRDVALWNVSRSAISCTMAARYGGAFPNWPCPAERIVGTSAQNSNF